MSPPGKNAGFTTKVSVVNASRSSPTVTTAPSPSGSRCGLRNAGAKSVSMRRAVLRPPPPWASSTMSPWSSGAGQLSIESKDREAMAQETAASRGGRR
jgi:hypothetical protein